MRLKKLMYKLSGGFSPLRVNFVANITNVCNRSCGFCPYHSPNLADNYHTAWYKSQPRMLDYKDFSRFIQRVRPIIKTFAITGKGEPFMHPNMILFCYLLNDYNIPFTVTTNGYSVGGIREVLDFEYLTAVRVSVYDQIPYALTKISNDKLTFFNMTGKPMEGIESGYISGQYGIQHERAITGFNKTDFCKAPFYFQTINTDGSIVPCYSYDHTANINDSLWKIWNGKRIRKYRRQAVNGRNLEFADCDSCGVNMK